VVLHTLENNRPIALFRLDDRILDFKVSPCIHSLNLGLQQTFDRLVKGFLYFPDANASALGVEDVFLNHQLSKGMGLTAAPTTPCTLVSAGACQW
jgi:hypothetical protein